MLSRSPEVCATLSAVLEVERRKRREMEEENDCPTLSSVSACTVSKIRSKTYKTKYSPSPETTRTDYEYAQAPRPSVDDRLREEEKGSNHSTPPH